MTLAMTIRSIIELAAVILLIIGFINEKKLVAFEVQLSKAIRIHLRNRRIRKQREFARECSLAQRRAPADLPAQGFVITALPTKSAAPENVSIA